MTMTTMDMADMKDMADTKDMVDTKDMADTKDMVDTKDMADMARVTDGDPLAMKPTTRNAALMRSIVTLVMTRWVAGTATTVSKR